MRTLPLLPLSLFALAACGADDPRALDGRPADAVPLDSADPDADPGAPPDAAIPPDAALAAVVVVDCETVVDAFELTTSGPRFVPQGTLAIAVDGVIRFRPAGNHNFASAQDNPPPGRWRSGPPGHPEPFCVQFTAAGDYPYVCEPHAGAMNGIVRVE
jgi:plastocyanin